MFIRQKLNSSHSLIKLVIGGLLVVLVSASTGLGITTTQTWCMVDDHTRPLPGQPPAGWYYNSVGGDRGLLLDMNSDPEGCNEYSQASSSTYKAVCKRLIGSAQWTYAGMWYALCHPISNRISYAPAALFPAAIKPAYQPQLVGMEAVVNSIQSPAVRDDLAFTLQVKGFDGANEVVRTYCSWSGTELAGDYPKTFSFTFDPGMLGQVSLVTWLLDHTLPGDSIEVDRVRLLVEMPEMSRRDEAFVTSLAMLLDNYDATTGMVGDRSCFPASDFENVTATAKLAKLLAFGTVAGFVEPIQGNSIITNIARVLLEVVPTGPSGVDALWPHFTKNGGVEAASGSEWASGDTAYALLDLCVALQMSGDPAQQLPSALAHLQAIRWDLLHKEDGSFSHGYDTNGTMSIYGWKGFGMEYIGVALAALAGRNVPGTMGPPPTDNGSGFILHAGYPLIPQATDCWTNDWDALRRAEASQQTGWYADSAHANPYLEQWGLYGLSAGEPPSGDGSYVAYGIGGRYTPFNDGSNHVVVLHYSAMSADVQCNAGIQMWSKLNDMGIISPLNNLESMDVNPANGTIEQINYLKGSWNLALQAEGWAWTYFDVSRAAFQSVRAIPALAAAWLKLFPGTETNLAASASISASDGTYIDKVRITWSAVIGATGYELWRATTNAVSSAYPLCSVTATNTDDVSATPGQRYYYWVRAKNASGPSDLSSSDSGWRASVSPGVCADYDGDGLADPAIYDETTGTWRIKLSGSGYYLLVTTFNGLGGPGYASVAADYDGDRKADPAVYQETTGVWIILPSVVNYSVAVILSQTLGGLGYSAMSADYDGDQLADPGVYHRENGDWQIMLSSVNYSAIELLDLLGGTGYRAVAADYDGDRLADPAIYGESNGYWIFKLSSIGYVEMVLTQILGGTGYIPVPADYDGDGLADPAVMSQTSNEWIVMFSSGNYVPVHLTIVFE